MSQNSTEGILGGRTYLAGMFILVIVLTIIYGYYNGPAGSGPSEMNKELEFSTTTVITTQNNAEANPAEDSGEDSVVIDGIGASGNVTKDEADTSPITENRTGYINKSTEWINENKTNATGQDSLGVGKKVTLKYFWSKYCMRCSLDRRRGAVLLRRLLSNHPKIEFSMLDIINDENRDKMREYGIIGVPTYVLEVNKTSLIMTGSMSKRKIKKIEKIACGVLRDIACKKAGYVR